MKKAEIRAEIKSIRSQIPGTQQALLNRKLTHKISQSDLWHAAKSVAIYLSFNNEANISSLLKSRKNIYLPSIKGDQMQFQQTGPDSAIETLSFGLKQPKFIDQLTPAKIDLYLMPLVAFDLHGNRLGMGGGYYDRYFASDPPGIKAGIAFACQQVDQLPTDHWDVKLQHIFTEQKHYKL